MAKNKTINVKGTEIVVITSSNKDEYISLTGIARYRDAERSDYILQNWLRTRSTIEFCDLWEQLKNPAFKNYSGSPNLETEFLPNNNLVQ